METVFWKVWRNKFIRNQILFKIKPREINFGKYRRYYSLCDRIDYNLITSLEWMVDKKQYSMIKDKLKCENNNDSSNNQSYIHITNESIIKLIKSCNDEDTFHILFKMRRYDLERVDLIIESIKQGSMFALSTFIKLYGGVESVKLEYQNSPLLDEALKIANFEISNYLIECGLTEYTESMLIKNSLYINKESTPKSLPTAYCRAEFLLNQQPRQLNDLNDCYDFFRNKCQLIRKNIEGNVFKRIYTSYKVSKGKQPILRSISSSSPMPYKMIGPAVIPIHENHHYARYIHYIYSNNHNNHSKFHFNFSINFNNNNFSFNNNNNNNNSSPSQSQRLFYIRDKLNFDINQIIEKYKNDKNTFPNFNFTDLSAELGLSLLKNSFFKYDMVPDFGKLVPPLFNSKYDINFLIYLTSITVYGISISNICNEKSFIQLKILLSKKINNLLTTYSNHHDNDDIGKFMDEHINVIPAVYFIDYYFYQSNFIKIVENSIRLFNGEAQFNIFHLFNLSLSNFSIDGLKTLFILLEFIKIEMQYFSIIIYHLYSTKPTRPKKSLNELIEFFNYLETCWYQAMDSEQTTITTTTTTTNTIILKNPFFKQHRLPELPFPMYLFLEHLIRWYDSNTLISLVENCRFFKTKFISIETADLFRLFFIPNQETGCIDYEKFSLFLKYHGSNGGVDENDQPKNSTARVTYNNFFYEWDSLHHKDNFIEERVKLIHYLISTKGIHYVFTTNTTHYQYGKRTFDHLFNELFYSLVNSKPLETSINIYSKFNINQIYKSEFFKTCYEGFSNGSNKLENYFFDSFLNDAIIKNDKDSIIKIISTVLLKNNNNNNNAINENDIQINLPINNNNNNNATNILSKIQYLYTNDLLDSFGYNFTLMLIENLSEIVVKNNMNHGSKKSITITENQYLDIIKIIILKSKGTQGELPIRTHIKDIANSLELFRVLLFLENINNESSRIEFFKQIENKEMTKYKVESEIIENMSKDKNNAIGLFKMGYPEYLLNLFKKNTKYIPSQLKNKPKSIYFYDILNLSTQLFNLELYKEIFETILEPNNVEFKNLLGYAIIFNRLDIVKFLFTSFEVTVHEHPLLLEVFTYGDIRIAKWLFKEHSQIFEYSDNNKSNNNQSCCKLLSLNNIIKESLINGHVGLFKEIIKNFPNHHFEIGKGIINVIIKNGYQNVINYLFNIDKLIDLDYIIKCNKTAISTRGKISIEISDHFLSIINNIIEKQQQPLLLPNSLTTDKVASSFNKKRLSQEQITKKKDNKKQKNEKME
ncbi:hypothetical protein RB653_008120 [Dictyostelium firmibasis]|uniref:Ankyrin repeat-containing protein n=1 Tax=Dictyostelium firmibasis TaxID=79012 RepID=A0AAN7YP18_9MYCE